MPSWRSHQLIDNFFFQKKKFFFFVAAKAYLCSFYFHKGRNNFINKSKSFLIHSLETEDELIILPEITIEERKNDL